MKTKKKRHLKVVTMREHNLRDVAKMVRQLADDIEANEYGPVSSMAIAFIGARFEVFVFGDGINGESASPSAIGLFQAGALRITKDIEAFGKDTGRTT